MSTTIIGRVLVNGAPSNGVLVSCAGARAVTFNYQGGDGYYVLEVPCKEPLLIIAEHRGYVYRDTIPALSASQPFYQIADIDITVPQPRIRAAGTTGRRPL